MRFDVLEPPRTYLTKLYTPSSLYDKALHTFLSLISCVLRGFDEVRCARTSSNPLITHDIRKRKVCRAFNTRAHTYTCSIYILFYTCTVQAEHIIIVVYRYAHTPNTPILMYLITHTHTLTPSHTLTLPVETGGALPEGVRRGTGQGGGTDIRGGVDAETTGGGLAREREI